MLTDHFNRLTTEEVERLAVLLEELGEVQHIVGKILRHGYQSRNPHDIHSDNNRELLADELGHIEFAMALLLDGGDIDVSRIRKSRIRKSEQIWMYLHHNKKHELGARA